MFTKNSCPCLPHPPANEKHSCCRPDMPGKKGAHHIRTYVRARKLRAPPSTMLCPTTLPSRLSSTCLPPDPTSLFPPRQGEGTTAESKPKRGPSVGPAAASQPAAPLAWCGRRRPAPDWTRRRWPRRRWAPKRWARSRWAQSRGARSHWARSRKARSRLARISTTPAGGVREPYSRQPRAEFHTKSSRCRFRYVRTVDDLAPKRMACLVKFAVIPPDPAKPAKASAGRAAYAAKL